MRRADAVPTAIPDLVLGELLVERLTAVLTPTNAAAVDTLSALTRFSTALLAAFALICYEVVTANAIEPGQ